MEMERLAEWGESFDLLPTETKMRKNFRVIALFYLGAILPWFIAPASAED